MEFISKFEFELSRFICSISSQRIFQDMFANEETYTTFLSDRGEMEINDR